MICAKDGVIDERLDISISETAPLVLEMQSKCYSGIENKIKALFLDESIRCVSFDLFDTLVCRPFFSPEDLFRLLNPLAESLMRYNTPFHQMRADAEATARLRRIGGTEDITLDAVYRVIGDVYGIAPEILSKLREEECRLEIKLCRVRTAAKKLYELAKHLGKRVIIASDMYLPVDVVEQILAANGYGDRDALFLSSNLGVTKYTGNMFTHILREFALHPEEMLHIGDNRRSDYDIPLSLGIRAFHFPRAVDAMRSAGGGCCLDAAQRAMPPTMRKDVRDHSFGFNTAVALTANMYFDDPFRDFRSDSDFNGDPYLIGYHAVGMHLLSLAKWVEDTSKARGYGIIHYNARDGYLPMLFHRRLREAGAMTAECDYVYGSRTMLLPGLVNCGADFVKFIRAGDNTPGFFLKRFDFCLRDTDAETILACHGISMDETLSNIDKESSFLSVFLSELLDRDKLERSRKPLVHYYDRLATDGAAFFDIGYRGSNPSAISMLTGKKINVLYVHGDNADEARRMHGFTLDCFFPFTPGVSGALREHLLSETAPHCIAMKEDDDGFHPVFAADETSIAVKLTVSAVHKGALRFLEDYLGVFGDNPFLPSMEPLEMSLPLEGYLHFPRLADIEVFKSTMFENSFDMGEKRMNLYMYALDCSLRFSPFLHICPKNHTDDGVSFFPEVCTVGTLGQYIASRSNIHKFFTYLLLDRRMLVEILRARAGKSGLITGFVMRIAAWVISRFTKAWHDTSMSGTGIAGNAICE